MKLKNRAFPLILTITLLTGFAGLYIYHFFQQSEEEIIAANQAITKSAVSQLAFETQRNILPIWKEQLFGKNAITKAVERSVDSLFSDIVKDVLINYERVEGGVYFYELDEFIGYGFPTIAPPIPAFGPPPRSYNIIREQVRETITQDSFFTRVHEFDPAIFPLSTKPLMYDGEIIGAAWARKHIERELAATQSFTSGNFLFTFGLVLFFISLSIFIAYSFKKHIQEIRKGLNRMKKNPGFRLKERHGVLGFINRHINDMMNAQMKEQEKRKRLERELYQTEKMATLGNLIAGAAHEINTPISIIKTRTQIWERKLKKNGKSIPAGEVLTDESIHIVHSEINRVSDLIKRLLLLSKPVGKLKKPIYIHDLLEEKINWIKQVYPDKQIETFIHKDSQLPLIQVDPQSIDQVFMNILKNAVESSKNHCRIEISTHFLNEVSAAEITVRDYGRGIPKSIINQVFDPFFTTKESGTGLGLSISYEFIKAHGGTLHFEIPTTNEQQTEIINTEAEKTINVDAKTSEMWSSGKYYTFSKGLSESETIRNSDNNRGTLCVIRLPLNS